MVGPVTFIEAHCNMFLFPKSFKLSTLRLHHKVTLIIVEHKERETHAELQSANVSMSFASFGASVSDQFTKSERVNSM